MSTEDGTIGAGGTAAPKAGDMATAADGVATTGADGVTAARADGVAAVRCTGLTYSFGRTKAVDGVDLRVEPGEVFGLLGPNGAGKTTTLRSITTLLPVPPGVIEIFGRDAARRKMMVRRLLGYVPQQLSADGGLTGRENVDLFARVFDVSHRERRERVGQALEAVGLAGAADRLAATYSGGMVRLLELAQALVSAPRLLVLDEPTIGLDPIARGNVWDRITEIRSATGMTVLVTTHSMEEADQRCDRLALLHRGKVRALGTPGELKSGLMAHRRETGDGETALPSLEDVFRHVAGGELAGSEDERGEFGDVRRTRRTASRVG
ncbi:ATP-binding cassette domain-containing protein [Streptomyces klenkii]|nr:MULTISPECIES: ATP-binding cassette domain-containing protein [Streptomyces]